MFNFKTKPFAHQLKAFELSKDAESFGLFMEQRTGKTKVILDTAAYLFDKGEIKTLIVCAFPNGLHRSWVSDEAPVHMAVPYRSILWGTAKGTRSWKRNAAEALASTDLLLVAVNVEALPTESCRAFLREVLKRGPVLTVIDESTCIATPGAQRTKVALLLGKASKYRRILTGTPVDQGPLKLYSQFMFLDPAILGFTSFYAFKHFHAEWEKGYNSHAAREFEQIKTDDTGKPMYKNLDILQSRIAPYSFRVLKSECFDLPPQIYQKRYFQLTKTQQRLYDTLSEEYAIELADERRVTATHVLTRMLRLQQITCGYLPTDAMLEVCPACAGEGCETCTDLGVVGSERITLQIADNPRLDALMDEIEKATGQIIVWAKFNNDIDLITKAFREKDITHVQYDGRVSEKQRAENKLAFQSGAARVFVGKARAGGRGLELACANTVIYYSNEFSLELRHQSEDRAHGPKQTRPVDYVDIIAEDTVDERILEILRNNQDVAQLITGDPRKAWI